MFSQRKKKEKKSSRQFLRQRFKQHSSFGSFKNDLAAEPPTVMPRVTNKGQATGTN